MSSVLVFQLVMLGIFGLNSNYQSAMWALIPLPLISSAYTLSTHARTTHARTHTHARTRTHDTVPHTPN